VENIEGKLTKNKTYKDMVLILHAKKCIKVHIAKLLAKTICRTKRSKEKRKTK